MPQVLSTQDVSHWQEMAEDLPWSRSMMQAGLTCLAGVPLKASSDAQGILWIARRGGEQIGRHHIYLLEALAPVIAARLESAHIRQCMYRLELTDPVTDLPNRQFFDDHVRKLAGRAGESWCVLMVGLDRFGRLSEALNGDMIDRLRKMVAVTIQSVCRKSTFIGSVATGTFAVVAAKVDRKNAIALAERVRSSIAAQTLPLPDEKQLQVSASVGLAYSPDDGADGASLTDLALARMENARRAGGDRIDADGTAVDRMAG